jgi:hypothetical protein
MLPSVSDAMPSMQPSVSDAMPSMLPSVSDAMPSMLPSVSDAMPSMLFEDDRFHSSDCPCDTCKNHRCPKTRETKPYVHPFEDDRFHSSDCPCDTCRNHRGQFVVHLEANVYPQ